MASYEYIVKKQQAIENNIFVRRVRLYESYKEYQQYNKSRYDTYEKEKYYINEKVKRDMTKCNCNDNTDYSNRCKPMELRIKICPMRVETAKWFIDNGFVPLHSWADGTYFNCFTKDEQEDIDFYMTIHLCDGCSRPCRYYDDDIRGECKTAGCCKHLCRKCAWSDGGDYYCIKCRNDLIEKGEWIEEEQFDHDD